jgi:membrane protease YdiL (CAAX protease family)
MNIAQWVLIALTVAALIVTVVGYPQKYGALSGRSRLFRTIGMGLFDLLLVLVTGITFIDFSAGVSHRAAAWRELFYYASCLFLFLSIISVVLLDLLESISRLRRERRAALDKLLRSEIDKAFAERDASLQSQRSVEGAAPHDLGN